jgi:hypothetical protein
MQYTSAINLGLTFITFLLLTTISATPLGPAQEYTPYQPSLASRQNVPNGGSCKNINNRQLDPTSDQLYGWGPDGCVLTPGCEMLTYQNQCRIVTSTNRQAGNADVFVFDKGCDLIGYHTNEPLNTVIDIDSELPYVLVTTLSNNGVNPYFWYAGVLYKTGRCWIGSSGAYVCTIWFWCT